MRYQSDCANVFISKLRSRRAVLLSRSSKYFELDPPESVYGPRHLHYPRPGRQAWGSFAYDSIVMSESKECVLKDGLNSIGDESLSKSMASRSHPLLPLSEEEIVSATSILHSHVTKRMNISVDDITIQSIGLKEPSKISLLDYLEAEHAGIPAALRPVIPRLVDVVFGVQAPYASCESVVCLDTGVEVRYTEADKGQHGILGLAEMNHAIEVLKSEEGWQDALKALGLSSDVDLEYEAWPYGADKFSTKETHRLIRILPYSKTPCNHPDSNVFARPIPLAGVYDVFEEKIIVIDEMPTDGVLASELKAGASFLDGGDLDREAIKDFTPELNTNLRPNLKPISITQPEGVNFSVEDKSLVQWQKWRFRVGFNAREGLTLHDIRYDGRSVFHRLSMSEMSVPYGDPRPPFHLKQAFDLGDIGAGSCANSLDQGCDCLGSIYYFDAWAADPSGNGKPFHMPNVICMHEQDDGVCWRHFNCLSESTVVVRNVILILQTVITLGNYDYIVAWHFDQAGAIHFELRATGALSTHAIDAENTSPWGTVVAPGVFAPNHQHFVCVRIDPAIGSNRNSVMMEEAVPLDLDDERNPHGNGWQIVSKCIETSSYADASPMTNRAFKIVNEGLINPTSHRAVGYKLSPVASSLLLAHPSSTTARRAKFASHHIWVTRHRDDMLYAGGKWTTQSIEEIGGVADEVAKKEKTRNADVVLWHSFGMTHAPRVEDFPVMPVEKLGFSLKPTDFFLCNPALDVPPIAKGTCFKNRTHCSE